MIQNQALLGRLQAAQSSAGSAAFPGLPEHKEDPGLGFAMGIMPAQTRDRAPAPSARASLGWGGTEGPARDGSLLRGSLGDLLGSELH